MLRQCVAFACSWFVVASVVPPALPRAAAEEALVRDHVKKLQDDDGYLLEIVEAEEGTAERKALLRHAKSVAGGKQIIEVAVRETVREMDARAPIRPRPAPPDGPATGRRPGLD